MVYFKNRWWLWKAFPGKFCNFYPHLRLETVFPALKLTQNCCIKINIYFLENWRFNRKKATPLLHTYHAWKTILTFKGKIWQSDKIWKYGEFKNPNSLTPWWIGRNMKVQAKLISENLSFPSLSWIGKNWVHESNIQESQFSIYLWIRIKS